MNVERITDPWELAKMSFEDAAIHLVSWGEQTCSNPMHDAMNQMAAAKACIRDRVAIEQGDGVALLNAICRCFEHAMSVPDWLSKEFVQRVDRITNMQAKDWSDREVFGKPYPKRTKPRKEREDRIQSILAYLIVAKEISNAEDKSGAFKNALGSVCNELNIEDERTAERLFEKAITDNNF
jgi:hypothetical protein